MVVNGKNLALVGWFKIGRSRQQSPIIVLSYVLRLSYLVIIYLGPPGCVFTYEWLHWFEGQWRFSDMLPLGIASLTV